MTLKEFREKHGDLMLKKLTWDDLTEKASGAALFYVSLSSKDGPVEDKAILSAGHILTGGIGWNDTVLDFIRSTKGGRVTLDCVSKKDIDAGNRILLFDTVPLPKDDPRGREPWNKWS